LIVPGLDRIGALLDGTELVEPGVVFLPRWRPDTQPVAAAVWGGCADLMRRFADA
jgi:hypothetical protein